MAACAIAGCDATVTSVGDWEPIVQTPATGGAGTAGTAGSTDVAGSGGTAGSQSEGGAGGEPDSPGLYLEAEDGELSGGFSIVADVAASNGQYIQPPTGPALEQPPVDGTPRARYTFELADAGDYVIWGRIYSPDVSSNRFWFQVDGGAWTVWRITVGEIWFWDDFHPDSSYNDTLHFLDRLYITSKGDEPPGNDTPCYPPHSIDRGGGDCFESCGAQAPPGMHTTCQANLCAGKDPLSAYDCNVCCVVP